MKEREYNSLRHFPGDLLMASGLPVVIIAVFATGFFQLRGTQWLAGFVCAMNMAAIGTLFLLRAKWPLYRQRKFWTWGSRDLPEGLKRAYRIGWWLSCIGLGAAALLIVQSLLWR